MYDKYFTATDGQHSVRCNEKCFNSSLITSVTGICKYYAEAMQCIMMRGQNNMPYKSQWAKT